MEYESVSVYILSSMFSKNSAGPFGRVKVFVNPDFSRHTCSRGKYIKNSNATITQQIQRQCSNYNLTQQTQDQIF